MKRLLTIVALIMGSVTAVQATEAKFSWLPNSESDLAGYTLHYGSESQKYSETIDLKLPPTTSDGRVYYTLQNAPDCETFYAITAYDSKGNESDYSNELQVNFAPSAPADFKAIIVNVTVNVNTDEAR